MYQYRFIKEEQYNQEHGVYTAYGICGYELAQNVMRETIYLPDVFLSKTVAERFVALCNELELTWSTCTMLYRTRSAGKQHRPDHDPNDAQRGEKSRKAQAKRKP